MPCGDAFASDRQHRQAVPITDIEQIRWRFRRIFWHLRRHCGPPATAGDTPKIENLVAWPGSAVRLAVRSGPAGDEWQTSFSTVTSKRSAFAFSAGVELDHVTGRLGRNSEVRCLPMVFSRSGPAGRGLRQPPRRIVWRPVRIRPAGSPIAPGWRRSGRACVVDDLSRPVIGCCFLGRQPSKAISPSANVGQTIPDRRLPSEQDGRKRRRRSFAADVVVGDPRKLARRAGAAASLRDAPTNASYQRV